MTPKLDWLEGFAEFGEDLNFTHAAARLHVSQPALHAQVRKLADALGVSLYERRGRRLVLTEAGVDALRFAREMRARSRNFVASVRGAEPSTPVVLAAGEGAFLYLLGPGIRRFVRSGIAPLRLMTRAADPAIEAVRLGDADLAVAVCPETPDSLHGEVLANVPHIAALPKDHRLADRKKITLAALVDEPLVVPPQGSPLRRTLAAAFASHDHVLTVAVEASGWEPMLHFATLGLGIAVVNGCCRLPRGLVGVPISDLPRLRYMLLRAVRTADPRPDPRVDALRQAIIARARPNHPGGRHQIP